MKVFGGRTLFVQSGHNAPRPPGERRPADLIGVAVKVVRIATGEEEDERTPIASAAAQFGKLGGAARTASMTPERRAEIARKAATKRWGG